MHILVCMVVKSKCTSNLCMLLETIKMTMPNAFGVSKTYNTFSMGLHYFEELQYKNTIYPNYQYVPMSTHNVELFNRLHAYFSLRGRNKKIKKTKTNKENYITKVWTRWVCLKVILNPKIKIRYAVMYTIFFQSRYCQNSKGMKCKKSIAKWLQIFESLTNSYCKKFTEVQFNLKCNKNHDMFVTNTCNTIFVSLTVRGSTQTCKTKQTYTFNINDSLKEKFTMISGPQ